jgi:ABC-type Na+ transport system ATPase subunit NatA
LKKINSTTEKAFKKFSLGLKKAERATLLQNRKIISKDEKNYSVDRPNNGLDISFNRESMQKILKDAKNLGVNTH